MLQTAAAQGVDLDAEAVYDLLGRHHLSKLMSRDGLSEATREWLSGAPVSFRKRLGQYMTPVQIREQLLDYCDLRPGMRVLDPGVGTGEFLLSVKVRQPMAELHGWDVDSSVLSVARRSLPDAHLALRSALDLYRGESFDLVIGNPPYFQFKSSQELRSRFSQVISGRVNIFALFFQVGLQALRRGGQLAYVVPPSMNTGAYFERLRAYLVQNADVEYLKILANSSMFDGARTPVQLIVLRAGARDRRRHVFTSRSSVNGFERTILAEAPSELEQASKCGRTLFELGYEAVTGSIVWNQHKSALRQTSGTSAVLLIWAHNITDGRSITDGLSLNGSGRRPQYIQAKQPSLEGPAIVTNRVVGPVGAAQFRCALVPEGMKFFGENHVNVIRPHGEFTPLLDWGELLESLRNPGTVQAVRMFTGNAQISATELTHLVPLRGGSRLNALGCPRAEQVA